MRILFVEEFTTLRRFTGMKNFGGIETTTHDHIRELVKRGHEVITNRPFPDGAAPDIIASSLSNPLTQERDWRFKRKYKKAAVIQHAHTTVEDMIGAYPKFVEPFLPMYLRKSYSYSHMLITPSEYSKRCLQKAKVHKLIYVMSSGIHDEDLVGTPENRTRFREFLRQQYQVPEDKFVVANVGWTWERKGLDRFFFTAKKCPDVFFIWVGKLWASKFLDAAKKLPNCAFPGFYADIRDVYYGADCLFFPSYVENLGLPLIEASMCQLPIVASSIDAFDWLPDKTHCLKGNSPAEYKQAIEFLRDNPEVGRTFGEKSRELAMNLHSFKKIAPRLEELYYTALTVKNIYDKHKWK